MTLQEFQKTAGYIELDAKGVQTLKQNYSHVYDEYDYDSEWQDTVEGVLIYDGGLYIFKHNNGYYSTVIGRENYIEQDVAIIEQALYEYCEYADDEYKISNY